MLTDSHCHLTYPELADDLAGVLARAQEAGVTRLVHVATSVPDAWRAFELLGEHEQVSFAVGLHPHEAKLGPEQMPALAALARREEGPAAVRPRIVAIGETGLDFHYNFSPPVEQEAVFHAHLDLASATGLPVIIHAREAEQRVCAILREHPAVAERTVFHCFGGDLKLAREVLDGGHWISFTGVVTFRSAAAVQEAAKYVPDDRIMVETDAPYLSPEPHRKQRPNEPALVVHTARFLAQLRGVNATHFAKRTTANACRFFGLTEEQT